MKQARVLSVTLIVVIVGFVGASIWFLDLLPHTEAPKPAPKTETSHQEEKRMWIAEAVVLKKTLRDNLVKMRDSKEEPDTAECEEYSDTLVHAEQMIFSEWADEDLPTLRDLRALVAETREELDRHPAMAELVAKLESSSDQGRR